MYENGNKHAMAELIHNPLFSVPDFYVHHLIKENLELLRDPISDYYEIRCEGKDVTDKYWLHFKLGIPLIAKVMDPKVKKKLMETDALLRKYEGGL